MIEPDDLTVPPAGARPRTGSGWPTHRSKARSRRHRRATSTRRARAARRQGVVDALLPTA